MKRALLFPGQGSQRVGMGRDLAESSAAARAVWEEVDEALGEPLSQIAWEGPEDRLTLTENAQPAIMAASVAAARALEAELGRGLHEAAACAAGHSLGEYAALCALGAIEPGACASVLRERGLAMQEAVPVGEGAMVAVLGLDIEAVQGAIAKLDFDGVCAPANDNAPGQVTLSGDAGPVRQAADACLEAGARKAVPLAVSAPFHCALMAPAAGRVERRLAEVDLRAPRLPVVANVTAAPEADPERIRTLLVEQVTAMVRWRESVERMAADGVGWYAEFGAGRVLAGLVRRIQREAETQEADSPEQIGAMAEQLA